MQFIDLVGLIDISDATFSYVDWDYSNEFVSDIMPSSDKMYANLKKFNYVEDFTMDATNAATHSALVIKLMRFIDKINTYNQRVTRHDFYDHAVQNAFPFAELIIIKLSGTDTIVKVMLNKYVTKQVSETNVVYTLNSELYMSKYLYNYSTYQSDYTSLYIKMLYNMTDYETVNKESLVVSEKLWPMIRKDSTKLFFDITLDSTVSNVDAKYTFFDLTQDELLWLNNKYFCRVKEILDNTVHDSTYGMYSIDSTYLIEFLEFDTTTDLSVYMGQDTMEYLDFTHELFEYYFNLRSVKKLNFSNSFFEDNTSTFFKVVFSVKTFFGYLNRPINEVVSDWRQLYSNSTPNLPITYSGNYDITHNASFNLLSLLNSFLTDKFSLPYDITILKSDIQNGSDFTIDLFIMNSTDITNFVGNWVRNGIYIFTEGGIRDAMVLRASNYSQLNENTFRLYLSTLVYDSSWFGEIGGIEYHIPASSYLIQYKYHIYNVIPYLMMNQFRFSNDLNNLITIHSFGYVATNPTVLQWNGRSVNV